ncbi:hypothetical protein XENOCAPTIV_021476, partial [Xenoophorus captivus]
KNNVHVVLSLAKMGKEGKTLKTKISLEAEELLRQQVGRLLLNDHWPANRDTM